MRKQSLMKGARGGGSSRVNNAQQLIFQLKQKVVLSLNKLSDRDTCQLGVAELEKTAQSLSPESISPFLSCILDTDNEQKTAVRKECVRLLGTLARFHQDLILPYLGKMIGSVVKRLKDPDSAVRDACVETVGVLASKLGGNGTQRDGVFVTLVKPLFESLGEQNKQIQSGSALCLAKVIDHTCNPPVSVLQRMLNRTIKLLNNPHFMAKPAVVELNRSIIQAGGAVTETLLVTAIGGIQEVLKNSDWTTRKAASAALAELASTGGSCLGNFKASCIRSLESCRFDKVKPVRDTVLHALRNWKSIPGPSSPENSEDGSCRRENSFKGNYSDCSSGIDSRKKDALQKKVGIDFSKRTPLSARITRPSFEDSSQHSKAENWQIEIAVPRRRLVPSGDNHNEESEGSSIINGLDIMSTEVLSFNDLGYVDDKQESSSVSNTFTDNYETKFEVVSSGCHKESNDIGSQYLPPEAASGRNEIGLAKVSDRISIDSTLTESGPQTMHGCLQVESEISSIRKQLSEIEKKQTNLMDMLQVFATNTTDGLSLLKSKVLDLEHKVDRMAQDIAHVGRYPDPVCSSITRQSQIQSPRFSTSTPRPSVDISTGQHSLLSIPNSKIWEDKASGKSRPRKLGTEMWENSLAHTSRNSARTDIEKRLGRKEMAYSEKRNFNAGFISANSNSRKNVTESKKTLWKQVNIFLQEGDLDSAYVQALCSGDDLLFIELLDKTGPVLDSLSPQTSSDVLKTLTAYFLEKKLMNSILPWLQQLVDLSRIHGPNYLFISTKTGRELLSVIQQYANMNLSGPEEGVIAQLAMKLHQLWGICS